MTREFARTEHTMRSRRARKERQISKLIWVGETDPMADLGYLGERIGALQTDIAILTQRIEAHTQAHERRALRLELLAG